MLVLYKVKIIFFIQDNRYKFCVLFENLWNIISNMNKLITTLPDAKWHKPPDSWADNWIESYYDLILLLNKLILLITNLYNINIINSLQNIKVCKNIWLTQNCFYSESITCSITYIYWTQNILIKPITTEPQRICLV